MPFCPLISLQCIVLFIICRCHLSRCVNLCDTSGFYACILSAMLEWLRTTLLSLKVLFSLNGNLNTEETTLYMYMQYYRNCTVSLVHTVPDFSPGVATVWFHFFKPPGLTGMHWAAKQHRLIPGHYRSSSGMNRISTVRPPCETVANRIESTVEIQWLPAWPRRVTEQSKRSPDSCRSNYGLARLHPMNAGKVTVGLRYDYGRSRCTPIQQQKQYLNHVCLLFNQAIWIILNSFFISIRWV